MDLKKARKVLLDANDVASKSVQLSTGLIPSLGRNPELSLNTGSFIAALK